MLHDSNSIFVDGPGKNEEFEKKSDLVKHVSKLIFHIINNGIVDSILTPYPRI